MKKQNLFSPGEGLPGGKQLKVKRRSDEVEVGPGAKRSDDEAGQIDSFFSRRPLIVMATLSCVLLLVLSGRLFSLQIVHGQHNLELAEGNRIREKISRAPRGIIYDRNGEVLAENTAGFDVTVTASLLPQDEGERKVLYSRLSDLIDVSVGRIEALSEDPDQNPFQTQLIASGLSRNQALLVEQALPDLPGFHLDVNPTRKYLDDGLLSHFLGYIGRVSPEDLEQDNSYLPTDYTGKLGLERQYEQILRGKSGRQQLEVDAQGNPVRILASVPAEAGRDLRLTIDFGLQRRLAASLEAQIRRAGSGKGAAVAIDPRNGEVLAAVSLPTYDGNLFAAGISQSRYRSLVDNPAQPLFNKAIGGAYPTGSIIKPLVGVAALNEGTITASTTVNDTGALVIPHRFDPSISFTFRSYDPGGLGLVNVRRAIEKSSNVFFYTIGGGHGPIRGVGALKLAEYFRHFGLGKLTGIDVPGEAPGRVPTPEWKQQFSGEPWYTGDTYNLAVGQGDFLASPLQMAVATAAIASRGTVFTPYVAKAAGTGEELEPIGAPKILAHNFAAKGHIDIVREAMRSVVTTGTACCQIEQEVGVPVAGKTGTAETDSSGRRKPHAWFSAFAPYDDPRIVVVVLVENAGEGGDFALPVAKDALSWYFRHRR